LILLQLCRERNSRLGEARTAVVDRTRHEATGEERRRPEYLRIFERLRRSMRMTASPFAPLPEERRERSRAGPYVS